MIQKATPILFPIMSIEQLRKRFVLRSKLNLADYEQELKWIALVLGILSTIAVVQDWYPWTMVISLPFCLIWVYCAWLHTERQLKYINIIFSVLYVYGIVRYLLVG